MVATSLRNHIIVEQPLLNSIPDDLLSRFEPTFVEYYNRYSVGRLATHQVPIDEFRRKTDKYKIAYGREIVDDAGLVITEEKCPVDESGAEITIRIFQPAGAEQQRKPSSSSSSRPRQRPAYINFHGGGWVFGGLDTDNDFCKRVVQELGCVAFDVDYRLAPEHRFPIPVDDCWAAINWIRETKAKPLHLDLDRIALGGCSAGGHLTAVMAHLCRDHGIPLALQLLGTPVCDMHVFDATVSGRGEIRGDCPWDSYREMYHTVPLSAARMIWLNKQFVGLPRPEAFDTAPLEWKLSPIRAPNFGGLAPALILTAEMDPLRDEGEAYGDKMRAAGCEVQVIRVRGAPHMFMQYDAILDSGLLYNREALRALRTAFEIGGRGLER